MRSRSLGTSLLRFAVGVFALSVLACLRSQKPLSSVTEERIVVYGTVTKSDSTPASGALIRSAASPETRCDAHQHSGGGVPEEVRASANGSYRQLVVSQGRPGCIRVTAASADGRSTGYSTVIAPRTRPTSATPPDSIRLDLRLQ